MNIRYAIVALAAVFSISASGCGGEVAQGEPYQAASETLQQFGISSYRISPATSDGVQFDISFKNDAKVDIGELTQHADGSFELNLSGGHVIVKPKDAQNSQLDFTLGQQMGHIAMGDTGPAGDPQSLALWEQAKPFLDTATAILSDLQEQLHLSGNNHAAVGMTGPPGAVSTSSVNCAHPVNINKTITMWTTCNPLGGPKACSDWASSWDGCLHLGRFACRSWLDVCWGYFQGHCYAQCGN